jgi:hypothetical protein
MSLGFGQKIQLYVISIGCVGATTTRATWLVECTSPPTNDEVETCTLALCRNPTLRECEDETHIPEMGTCESFGVPETSEFDCRGQNTLHWGVLYIIGKLSKCQCQKWACMGHLDIYSTRYGKKKGQESNMQFDSRPLKVGNRPDLGACR